MRMLLDRHSALESRSRTAESPVRAQSWHLEILPIAAQVKA